MELLAEICKEYGMSGLIFLALVYIVLRSKFTIEYPNSKKGDFEKKM